VSDVAKLERVKFRKELKIEEQGCSEKIERGKGEAKEKVK
jgi:hypothetical protein